MKQETKRNIYDAFQTVAIGIMLFFLVTSLHQSCSNMFNKSTSKEVKKSDITPDTIKNDTIKYFFSEQRVR